MLKRIITAVVCISLFIPVCIFSDTLVFPIIFSFLSLVATVEVLRCVGNKNMFIMILSCILAVCGPVLSRIVPDSGIFILAFFAVSFVYLLINMTVSVFSHGKYDVEIAALSFMTVFYVISSFTSIVLLRDTQNGQYIYLLAFVGPWVSDTFAYFTGYFFGKHKLIEDVSPKKTVEGSIGGILFTGVSFIIYALVLIHFVHASFDPSYVALAIVGFIVSIISQIGDLMASLIKRKFGVKDYGKLFPGHGGVMDRFDSVLPVAPLLLIITQLLTHFGFIR